MYVHIYTYIYDGTWHAERSLRVAAKCKAVHPNCDTLFTYGPASGFKVEGSGTRVQRFSVPDLLEAPDFEVSVLRFGFERLREQSAGARSRPRQGAIRTYAPPLRFRGKRQHL